MNHQTPTITMREETDPVEIARARESRAKFELNYAWLEAHAAEVYCHRGKFYCICGQQAFVADTVEECVAEARAAHPDDDGRFTGYIPLKKLARIYANRW
jgi:hypothetical protein